MRGEIPIPELAEALRSLEGFACAQVGISAYGALQLGFGPYVAQIIAGKYHKRRYAYELGTYDRSWSLTNVPGATELGPGDSEQLRNALTGLHVVSLAVSGSMVSVTFGSGAVLRVVAMSDSDDIFYIYAPNGISAFYVPSSGWVIEQGVQ